MDALVILAIVAVLSLRSQSFSESWDMKPLEKWEYKRPTLMELAMTIKREMEG